MLQYQVVVYRCQRQRVPASFPFFNFVPVFVYFASRLALALSIYTSLSVSFHFLSFTLPFFLILVILISLALRLVFTSASITKFAIFLPALGSGLFSLFRERQFGKQACGKVCIILQRKKEQENIHSDFFINEKLQVK